MKSYNCGRGKARKKTEGDTMNRFLRCTAQHGQQKKRGYLKASSPSVEVYRAKIPVCFLTGRIYSAYIPPMHPREQRGMLFSRAQFSSVSVREDSNELLHREKSSSGGSFTHLFRSLLRTLSTGIIPMHPL